RRAPTETAPAAPTAAELPAPSASLAEIKGRFLLPGEAPASGVEVQTHGWPGNQERVMKFGEPDKWEDPKTTSGPDGRFSIRLDPPRAFQFTLDARCAGYGGVSWRWSETAPAETKDVGDVELTIGGAIVGRVLDPAGNALTKDWMVYADSARSSSVGFG